MANLLGLCVKSNR